MRNNEENDVALKTQWLANEGLIAWNKIVFN